MLEIPSQTLHLWCQNCEKDLLKFAKAIRNHNLNAVLLVLSYLSQYIYLLEKYLDDKDIFSKDF